MRRTEFDMEASRAAADTAIEQASRHANPEFTRDALQAVHALASRRVHFTTDAVWALMSGQITTHEPRALGAVMRRAQKLGWIAPTDEYRCTVQVAAHRRPKRVWRSTLCG